MEKLKLFIVSNLVLEFVSCDLCGCSNYRTRYRQPDTWLKLYQYEFNVVECINCGLVYVNPRPITDSMKLFYPFNYHDNRNTSEYLFRYKVQMDYLPKLNNETILDIGCARGDFLSYLKNIYPNIITYGVDLFSDKVDFDFVKFTNDSLPNAKFHSDSFDFVTAWAVFEHLHCPGEYFEEVSRVLKKGGKFIFLVTNSESIYGKYAYKEDIPRHTYHFSEKTLNGYAEKFGFKSTKFFYETRLWDGTGLGAFKFKFMEITGSNWEKRTLNQINKIQLYAGRLGHTIDKVVFSSNWEARLKRSGIIVVEFSK